MAKIKKIREIKSKIKIIREIERNEGEEELVEDIEKAEDDFRREVAVSSGIEASSLVLESDIKESRGAEKTQLRAQGEQGQKREVIGNIRDLIGEACKTPGRETVCLCKIEGQVDKLILKWVLLTEECP